MTTGATTIGAGGGDATPGAGAVHSSTGSTAPRSAPPGRRTPAPLPTGAEKAKAVRHMFDAIADRYELLNSVMALGMDRAWRRRCIDALDLPAGALVLDVACGTGDLCRHLDRRGLRPLGADISAGMLAHARVSAPLVLADALAGPFRAGRFDGAVSGFALRNVVDLGALCCELARITRPGGRISLLDLCEPDNRLLRFGHHLWANRAIPLIGSALSDAEAYHYLPRSLAYLPPAEEVVKLLESAGFVAVQRERLTGGICQLYVATRARAQDARAEDADA
jgi:demethylmenaquinone methyltransferase/2-methoxy-6-polyprenyl-1,4-benzoquinol methylase